MRRDGGVNDADFLKFFRDARAVFAHAGIDFGIRGLVGVKEGKKRLDAEFALGEEFLLFVQIFFHIGDHFIERGNEGVQFWDGSSSAAGRGNGSGCFARRFQFGFFYEGIRTAQREVGFDVATFGDGLRDALRQAPDCILASEIRDRETAEAAIYGGEAGALMIVTTHGTSIAGTLRKMVALTGDGASTAMRGVLAGSLIGVVRQELVPCKDESGFIMVCDTLRDTDNVRRALERGDWHALEGICNVATPSADFSPLSATVNRLVADRSIGLEQGQAILAAQNRR